jgi:predicted phosphoribosyltransferase
VKRFRDRRDAGRQLARRLEGYGGRDDVAVLGLARGGVPVAAELAAALRAPLDVLVVRKLGVPGQEELAFGAIAAGGARVVNRSLVETLALSPELIGEVARRERRELERREQAYRAGRPPLPVARRHVLLVDDGLATGASMRAALLAVRRGDPAAAIVAVPVAPPETCVALAREADGLVCLLMPERFVAVSAWYERFEQTTDEEVIALLAAHADAGTPPP